MFNNKKGLSEVIATLIIILLVLVAVMVIWVVIRNVINTGSEQISLGKFTINVELEKVTVNPNTIDVVVKRNPGQGDLAGLKFVISDGANSQTIDSTETLSELEQKTITLNYVGIVKSVGVAPVIKQGTSNAVQEVADTITYSSIDAVNAMPGLVSWWRFEGNANDEKGLNNGVLNTGTSPSLPVQVQGKFGNAYKFDGFNNYISSTINNIPSGNNPITYLAWVKLDGVLQTDTGIVNYLALAPSGLKVTTNRNVTFTINTGTDYTSNNVLPLGSWAQVGGVYNSSTVRIYLNGGQKQTFTGTAIPPAFGAPSLRIGIDHEGFTNSFNGTIDEVMIFNRSLSDSEIQGLYGLNLDD